MRVGLSALWDIFLEHIFTDNPRPEGGKHIAQTVVNRFFLNLKK